VSSPILETRALAAGYGDVRVVHGISIEVERASITALVGANGAGKTTLLLALAGILPVAGGTIRYDGEDITRWMSHRRVDAGLVLVPEGRWVFPNLNVESNLRLGAIAPHARATWRTRIEEMYELFPRLRERRRQAAGLLSGGEQQMLAIARGLMARPKLLLLDEPTLGLAPIMAKQVFETIELLNRGGLSIMLAEQDVSHTLEICDHAYVVENGRVVMAGPGTGLIDDPRVKEAYFGL
jgi:branched-chain amino acid transport system ATP-binding protein